jgi:hypothetical protein
MGPLICTPNSPKQLVPAQRVFVDSNEPLAVYESGIGGGASTALLAAAVRDLSTPFYDALIVRRRLTDFTLPDGLWDTLLAWSEGVDFMANRTEWRIRYPNGSTVTFASADRVPRLMGSEFKFVGIDMIEEFDTPDAYVYAQSRLRAPRHPGLPLRCRVTTHDWRFTLFNHAEVIHASATNNPVDRVSASTGT